MPKKGYKVVASFLKGHGYSYVRTNAKGFETFEHGLAGEVMVNQAIDERAAVQLMRKLQKRLGEETDGDRAKRSSEKVRERQAVERQRLAADIERHEAEIADLLRRRDGRMDGLGAVLTGAEMRDIERLIERKQRELRDWRRLMTEIPTPSAHAGNAKAKHRA